MADTIIVNEIAQPVTVTETGAQVTVAAPAPTPIPSSALAPTGVPAGTIGDASHISLVTVNAAGQITGSTAAPMVVRDKGGQVFNVMAYGAVGDNVHDDTAAIQAAIDAAATCGTNSLGGGVVLFPPPPVQYKVTNTLVIQQGGSTNPTPNGACTVHLQGCSNTQNIGYFGPSNSAVFAIHGLKWSYISQINVGVNTGINNVIVFDIEPLANAGSSTAIRWYKCLTTFYINSYNNIGYRCGQSDPTEIISDNADFYWDHCFVQGPDPSWGNIGWHIGGSQTTPQTFISSGASSCGWVYWSGTIASLLSGNIGTGDTSITLLSANLFPTQGRIQIGSEQINYTGKTGNTLTGCTRGVNGTTAATHVADTIVSQYVVSPTVQGLYKGAQSLTWIGGSSSGNTGDFFFQDGGRYSICGARFESSQRIFQSNWGGNSVGMNVLFSSCDFSGVVEPSDGYGVFYPTGNTWLTLLACHFDFPNNNQSLLSNKLFNCGNTQTFASLNVNYCDMPADNPFFKTNNATISIAQTRLYDLDNTVVGLINQQPTNVIALTDAATVNLDLSQGSIFTLPLTNAVGANRVLTVTNGLPGQKFTLIPQQPASGGPCAVSWFAGILWQGGSVPTLTTTNSKRDVIDFSIPSSGVYLGTPRLNY